MHVISIHISLIRAGHMATPGIQRMGVHNLRGEGTIWVWWQIWVNSDFPPALLTREVTQDSYDYNNELKLQISERCQIVPVLGLNIVPLKLVTCKLHTNYMPHTLPIPPHIRTVGAGAASPCGTLPTENWYRKEGHSISGLQQSPNPWKTCCHFFYFVDEECPLYKTSFSFLGAAPQPIVLCGYWLLSSFFLFLFNYF